MNQGWCAVASTYLRLYSISCRTRLTILTHRTIWRKSKPLCKSVSSFDLGKWRMARRRSKKKTRGAYTNGGTHIGPRALWTKCWKTAKTAFNLWLGEWPRHGTRLTNGFSRWWSWLSKSGKAQYWLNPSAIKETASRKRRSYKECWERRFVIKEDLWDTFVILKR